ncbi:MAG: KamA family radical SAM protein [Alphaproteobacteria bacterium]|nr:KamA family radical SAM protein [Alphaproteobacteria bacterium]
MITSFDDLKKYKTDIDEKIKQVIEKYGIHITDYYATLINWENPEDPLFKIVVPDAKELVDKPDELEDPIGDNSSVFETMKTKMLIHRYPDRVLFLTTNKCAGRCRYCFRKCKVFSDDDIFDEAEFEKSLNYIKNTKTISEVILSGGDPLCMPREKFKQALEFIILNCPHIRGIRIHSRAFVYNPDILTDDLVGFLNKVNERLPVVLVTHIVHEREVTDKLCNALKKLNLLKVNQTPLLKGVNATVEDLVNLSWALVKAGVLPHYLHYLDKARGTSHFRVSIDEARELVANLWGHLGGHLIPKLILDMPDGQGKVALDKSFIVSEDYSDGHRLVVKSTYSDKVSEYMEQK